jgi:hypothetical protein
MRSALLTVALALTAGCTVKDPLFCDDTHPCVDPSRSYCDRTGDYEPEHIRNTCVANPFDAAPPADAPPSAAMLVINKDTFDFQDVQMGAESFAQQFKVTNGGQLASGMIAVSVSGANASSFVLVPTGDASDCEGKQLAPSDSCIVQVKYRAGAPGAESAVLHVDANPGGMPIVGLSGTSLAPGSLEITAGGSLDFGPLAILSTSATKTITVHNNGGVACTSFAIALKDTTNYKQVSTTCTASLAPNASCDINLQFTPQAVGSHASSVTISSDQGSVAPQLAGSGTSTVMVGKSGTGAVVDTLASPLVNCGSACSGTYDTTPITLHASASGGIPFNGWGGACMSAGKSADCTLSLTQPMYSVSASFGVCAPGAGMCSNNMLSTCDATGHWGTATACALGCYTDGTRCWDVDPLNGLAAALDDTPNQPAFTLSDGAQINTNTGTVVDGNGSIVTITSTVVHQATGYPAIRAFEVKSIKLGKTSVVGNAALAIVANGDIEIDGELHLVPSDDQGTTSAPGRMVCDTSNGAGGYSSSTTRKGGGGGGSFAGLAGRGGNNPPTNGGARGVMASDTSLSPLRGGCDGGMNANVLAAAEVGAGGGAVQFVSRTAIKIVSPGAINVGGGGGRGREPGPLWNWIGGNGGGSGGGVLLEAPTVLLSGSAAALAANGGGGSADCASGSGEDGKASAVEASGGACPGDSTRTSGGAGQAGQTLAAKNGVDLLTGSDTSQPGGGGGGEGTIRVDTNSFVTAGGAIVSGGFGQNPIGKR